MNLKTLIRKLKTSPWLAPILVLIDLVIWLTDWISSLITPHRIKPKTLLILRLDVLGDYLLFRNYLRVIRESEPYHGYHITFCGNSAIQSLAETFDSELIDQFVWVDIYALSTQLKYRFQFVRELRRKGFEVVFCPTYSRVLVLDDFLAWATGAIKRIGCRTDYVNIKRWEATLGDRLYTHLIDTGSDLVFEMERNRRIIEGFLQKPIGVQPPSLDSSRSSSVNLPLRFIVLSLGAGQEFRIWPAERFAAVATYIQENYPAYTILITGAPNERKFTDDFLEKLVSKTGIIDLTGKLTIPQLVYVLKKASLLITNETGIVHIAASTQTPTLVISQGKSLIRWHPYPNTITHLIKHIYIPELEQERSRFDEIALTLNPESPYSITAVSTERVIMATDQILKL